MNPNNEEVVSRRTNNMKKNPLKKLDNHQKLIDKSDQSGSTNTSMCSNRNDQPSKDRSTNLNKFVRNEATNEISQNLKDENEQAIALRRTNRRSALDYYHKSNDTFTQDNSTNPSMFIESTFFHNDTSSVIMESSKINDDDEREEANVMHLSYIQCPKLYELHETNRESKTNDPLGTQNDESFKNDLFIQLHESKRIRKTMTPPKNEPHPILDDKSEEAIAMQRSNRKCSKLKELHNEESKKEEPLD